MLAHPRASVPKAQVANSASTKSATLGRMNARSARLRVRARGQRARQELGARFSEALARGEELGAEADHPFHLPVLLPEVMEALEAEKGGSYIDATFGAGGYSRALLSANSATRVLGARSRPRSHPRRPSAGRARGRAADPRASALRRDRSRGARAWIRGGRRRRLRHWRLLDADRPAGTRLLLSP